MKKIITFSLFCMILFCINCPAQLSIYPPALFIDNESKSGSITVKNPQDIPKEIEVSLVFGYVGVDSNGNSKMIYGDSIPESKHSIKPYTTFYPKKLVLPPQQTQTVKFLIKNSNTLEDGIYWVRIVTTSQNLAQQIDSTNIKDSIRVNFLIKLSFVTVLFFEKGKLNASIDIKSLQAKTDTANLNLIFDFKHKGNSPFLGNANIILYNSDGDEIDKKNESVPIYFDSKRNFRFKKDKMKPGNYSVEITLDTERPEVPDEFKFDFERVKRKFNFVYKP
jgi:hypothetical protein